MRHINAIEGMNVVTYVLRVERGIKVTPSKLTREELFAKMNKLFQEYEPTFTMERTGFDLFRSIEKRDFSGYWYSLDALNYAVTAYERLLHEDREEIRSILA